MENLQDLAHALQYQAFLARALRHDTRFAPASTEEFITLLKAENGTRKSWEPTTYRQLKVMKKRLNRAVEIYLNLDLTKENKKELKKLLFKIEEAGSSNDILKIVLLGLRYTSSLAE